MCDLLLYVYLETTLRVVKRQTVRLPTQAHTLPEVRNGISTRSRKVSKYCMTKQNRLSRQLQLLSARHKPLRMRFGIRLRCATLPCAPILYGLSASAIARMRFGGFGSVCDLTMRPYLYELAWTRLGAAFATGPRSMSPPSRLWPGCPATCSATCPVSPSPAHSSRCLSPRRSSANLFCLWLGCMRSGCRV